MKRQKDGRRGERRGSPGKAAVPRVASPDAGSADPASDGFLGILIRPAWLPAALLVIATVLAYQPVWQGGFLWDDDMHITKNRMLSDPDGLRQIWSSPESPQYYPMVFTSFRLERALWGLNPAGYHWVNLFLHAASAVLLWRILRRLNVPGAWLASAVFALHPANVESVAWISQRKNTLAMFFYLLSALWYLRSYLAPRIANNPQPSSPNPQRRWYWLSLAAFALALLSKTAVSPYPVVLLGLAWWQRGKVTARDLARSVPFFVASLVLSLITIWFERHQTAAHVIRDDSFWARLAVAGWAVWFYLYKALLPLNLILIYPRWQCDPANVISYVPGALLAGAFVVLWWRRERWGMVWLFCAGYYVALLLPVLGFVNIGFMSYSLVADHWQYFAIIAPIALGVATCAMLARKTAPWVWLVIAGATLLMLGSLTWRQSCLYTNAEALWRGTLAANARCWPACYQLGLILVKQGRPDEAIAHFQEALQYQPNYSEARNNIGAVLLRKGAVDEAIAQYQEALRVTPNFEEAHNNLGTALLQKGKLDEAITHYQTALQAQPDYAEAHNNLGTALAQKGKMAEACVQYEEALRLVPGDPETQNNLALLLATSEEPSLRNGEMAVRLAREANDRIGGRNPLFLRTLAAALAETGRFSDAAQTARSGIELAQATGQPGLVARLSDELKLYEAARPLRH